VGVAQLRLAKLAVLATLLWWLLSRGDQQALLAGLFAVAAAVLVARRLGAGSKERLRLRALPRFVAFFLRESLRGGFDVAVRALRPRLDLQPGFVELPLGVRGDGPRALAALVVSLLPGTLAVRLGPESLTLHVIDLRRAVARDVARLDAEVALLFGQPVPPERAA
jgi:multicomponent Na+:H+ antiporter subunit E